MCRVIAISNQKGGIGKTTTTINLGVALVEQGYKVLLVDSDPQGNMTMGMGCENPEILEYTFCDLIQGEIEGGSDTELIKKCLFKGKENNIFFLPSNIMLSELENALHGFEGRENIFKKILTYYKKDFDFILIDCPPTLSILNINSLNASDDVIIPVAPQYFSAKGLELLLNSIALVKDNLNSGLNIAGILVTMVDNRSKYQKDLADAVAESYEQNIRIFKSRIPLSVKVTEFQHKGLSIIFQKNNKVGKAYKELTKELLGVGEYND